MPNKTKQNTKNSTEQICSQPLYKSQTTHHTHPHPRNPQAGCAGNHHQQKAADAHTVLNVNPTVCLLATKPLCPTQNAPTPTTHTQGSKHMQAQENNHTPTQQSQRTLAPHKTGLPRKEVIQPHLPVRLPCYDFVPIANPTFDHSPRKNG